MAEEEGGCVPERRSAVSGAHTPTRDAEAQVGPRTALESWLFGYNLAYVLSVGLQMDKRQGVLLIRVESV